MLVSSSITNLINGVSQQPVALRLSSQAEEQVNGMSSVVDGLSKRPPTRWLSKIQGSSPEDAYIHLINRDQFEQYVVLIADGNLQVFGLDGVERTVSFPDGKGYLTGGSGDFATVTVADFTFVVNKSIPVQMTSDKSTQWAHEALVWVKQGNYGTDYRIHLNGTQVASFTTPDGDDATDINQTQTDHIASQLASGVNGTSGWSCTRRGSTLLIKRDDGADFNIRTEDSFGDLAMENYRGTTQRFSELPSKAFNGFSVEVIGDNTSNFDNYYMKYDESAGAESAGVWRETLKENLEYRLDASTMPHTLIREADGTFTFQRGGWKDREVGDDKSNPLPSFVGRTINDVFFHRNRLGLIADESVILSRSAEFFNFWRTTATALLDNDPVDVAASHVKVSILRHAVPFNEELLLFSDQTQFILSAGSFLSPKTAAIRQTTEYESDLKAKPVGAGPFIYFAFRKGGYTGIREYAAQADQTGNAAEDATANVPRYVPGGVRRIAASSNEQTLVALSVEDPHSLYVYRYYYSGGEAIQASWSRWEFGTDTEVLDVGFIGDEVILPLARPDGLHIASLPVASRIKDEGSEYMARLDLRLDETQVSSLGYDPDTNTTSLTLPYAVPTQGRQMALVYKEGVPGQTGGVIAPPASASGSTLVVEGDVTGASFWVGESYPFLYKFTYPMLREDAVGGGQAAVTTGRLQVRTFSVTYTGTGHFVATVSRKGGAYAEYPYTGTVLGESVTGATSLNEGTHRFPVMAQNDTVEISLSNDTFLPCNFLSAEWEGFHVTRNRRL